MKRASTHFVCLVVITSSVDALALFSITRQVFRQQLISLLFNRYYGGRSLSIQREKLSSNDLELLNPQKISKA